MALDNTSNNIDVNSTTDSRVSLIPTNMIGQISETSYAPHCFINQRFSGRLQSFLIGYVNSVYSDYPIADS